MIKAHLLAAWITEHAAIKHSELERLAGLPKRSIYKWILEEGNPNQQNLPDYAIIKLVEILVDYGLEIRGWRITAVDHAGVFYQRFYNQEDKPKLFKTIDNGDHFIYIVPISKCFDDFFEFLQFLNNE
jgi:hypothetical protein